MHPYRTHVCNELRKADVGREVRLSGWVHRKRDHGGVIFIDLRDHYGLTQVVVNPDRDFFADTEHVRVESVLTITGTVVERTEDTVNPNLDTGEIEVVADTFAVESAADQLPFPVNQDLDYPEETRLAYRFVDLRHERLRRNILLRSRAAQLTRAYLTDRGFVRVSHAHPDELVAGRRAGLPRAQPALPPASFTRCPQAPQQFKQLLMIGGFDKYFQIAPCFRDEDSRADRSPGEFYQIDMEMSYVTQDDVFEEVEGLMIRLFSDLSEQAHPRAALPADSIPGIDGEVRHG